MSSPATRKPISDRISIFEQKQQSPAAHNQPSSTPSKHYPAKRTLSSKNVNSLKSQFDVTGGAADRSQGHVQTTPAQETSPPPPPPPRTLPPESPPQVPKRTSVTSKPKKPAVSPPSSGKASPTGGTKPTTTAGRKSPPGSKIGLNKSTPVSSKTTTTNATPTKKKPVSNNPSPTTPIPKNVGGSNGNKKVASRTTSSPISPQPQNDISQLEKSNLASTKTPPTNSVKKASLIQNNTTTPSSNPADHKNNNSKTVGDLEVGVPIIEVSLETPSATSTPNLNSKKSSDSMKVTTTENPIENRTEQVKQSPDTPDLVVNKNFINAAVTGSRYWTNQALQNDNSTKISQVVRTFLHF